MTREQAIDIITTERNYQDTAYPETATVGSGVTRQQRDKEVVPHILLLEEYAAKARQAWVSSGSNKQALQQIAKAAAIAMRALERVGNSEELLKDGLR